MVIGKLFVYRYRNIDMNEHTQMKIVILIVLFFSYIDNNDLTLANITFYVVGTRPHNKKFLDYTTGGVLTVEDCSIEMPEPFFSWGWNGTLIDLREGTFHLENTEFRYVSVGGNNKLIYANLNNNKAFTMNQCSFTNCGCYGDGKVIHVTTSSSRTTLTMMKCNFTSCFNLNSDGGCLYMDGNVEMSVVECIFEDCKALNGGTLYCSCITVEIEVFLDINYTKYF
jgi:hypothetical protein